MPRPVIYVLAGVNGAGKSSIGGALLAAHGATWYNPDSFARELKARTGCDQATANSAAWAEGMHKLERAIESKGNYAFETTLGGRTVAAALLRATKTHDVLMWYCGLASVELHLARVAARVAAGGHDIPEEKIRQRYTASRANLIALMPHLADLRVFDNSAPPSADGTIPDPVPVLTLQKGQVLYPDRQDIDALTRTPEWAKPLVEAAFKLEVVQQR